MLRVWGVAVLSSLVGGCGGETPPAAVEQPPAPEAPAEAAPDRETQRDAEVQYRSALELEARGQQQEALDAVDRAIQLHPTPSALLLGSKLAISMGKLERARRWTEDLIARAPETADAHYNLGIIAQRSNRYNEARSAYLAALRHHPKHADARFNLVVLTANAGVIEEAKYHRDRFLAEQPGDPREKALAKLVGQSAN